MNKSLKIAQLFGVPVKLHWTFLLLIIAAGYYAIKLSMAPHQVLWWALFSISVFVSILMHELGHVLAARRVGVETKDILLLPIGGLARLEKLPNRPIQELFVAIAGPLVNVVIALILIPFFWLFTKPALLEHDIPTTHSIADDYFFFLPLLLFLNLLLALFNMIPAFPMDGGRILRALLSIKTGRLRATKIAMIIGQAIAITMVLLGTWYGKFSYTVIGLFLSYTAVREYRWIRTEHLLAKYTAGESMVTRFGKLKLHNTIEDAVCEAERIDCQIFLVEDNEGKIVGSYYLGNSNMEKSLSIKEIYQQSFEQLEIGESLKSANEKFIESGNTFLPVYDNGLLIGVLNEELLWDFIEKHSKNKGHAIK